MSSRYGLITGAFLLACLSNCSEASSEVVVQRPTLRANPSIRPVNDRPLPEPYATKSTGNGSKVVERPDGAQLLLPEGFQIGEYTPDFTFQRPRFMVLGPSGEVLVSDSHDEGNVYVLQDTDQDGVADKRSSLIEEMYRPYGIAFWQDYVYVAGTYEIKRWKYLLKLHNEGETKDTDKRRILNWTRYGMKL